MPKIQTIFEPTGKNIKLPLSNLSTLVTLIGMSLINYPFAGIPLIFLGIYFTLGNHTIEINKKNNVIREMDYLPPFRKGKWKNLNNYHHIELDSIDELINKNVLSIFIKKSKSMKSDLTYAVHLTNQDKTEKILLFTSRSYKACLHKMVHFRNLLDKPSVNQIRNSKIIKTKLVIKNQKLQVSNLDNKKIARNFRETIVSN